MEALQTWLSGTSEKIAIYIETRKKILRSLAGYPPPRRAHQKCPSAPQFGREVPFLMVPIYPWGGCPSNGGTRESPPDSLQLLQKF